MKKRYVFWPFESRVHIDLGGAAHGIRSTMDEFKREGSGMSYVRYSSRKHLGRLSHCNEPNKTIYVTGHGSPGNHFIYPDPYGNGEAVHAFVLVGRLMEYGLKRSSRCKLKIFTCYSATGDDDSNGFAHAVTVALRHLKFKDIQVFGYDARVAPNDGNDVTFFQGTHPVYGNGVWTHASLKRVPFQ